MKRTKVTSTSSITLVYPFVYFKASLKAHIHTELNLVKSSPGYWLTNTKGKQFELILDFAIKCVGILSGLSTTLFTLINEGYFLVIDKELPCHKDGNYTRNMFNISKHFRQNDFFVGGGGEKRVDELLTIQCSTFWNNSSGSFLGM